MTISLRSLASRLGRISLPVLALAVLAAPAFAERGFLLPESISEVGDRIDNLFYFILVVTGVVFLATEGLLIYFLVRYRAKEGGKAHYTHGNHKAELIWTITPALVLLALAVMQFGLWRDIKAPDAFPSDDPDAIEVHVLGKQFAWFFRYPGPDKKFGTEDDYVHNRLEVPAGRPVFLQMRSIDVIHSLYLPELRFKQDLVPGLTITGWFKINEGVAGNYEIACAELCGASHYTMRGEYESMSYADWVKRDAELSKKNSPIDYASATEFFKYWPPSEFTK